MKPRQDNPQGQHQDHRVRCGWEHAAWENAVRRRAGRDRPAGNQVQAWVRRKECREKRLVTLNPQGMGTRAIASSKQYGSILRTLSIRMRPVTSVCHQR
jgi:hypothetical protein